MGNRDAFLSAIARRLGRERRQTPPPMPSDEDNPARTRLTELTAQQRCDLFIDYAGSVMLAHCELTPEERAADAVERLCDRYGNAPVLIGGDRCLVELGVTDRLRLTRQPRLWDPAAAEENIRQAASARIGVVYAEYGLVKSGSVVLFSSPLQGRSISLLPESTVFIVRKSRLLPRMAQLAQHLRQRGERLPSCINVIGGPSSTADIELIKVVGVHGPLNAAYLVIDDC